MITRVVSTFIYFQIYFVSYLIPLVLLVYLSDWLGFNLFEFLGHDDLRDFRPVFGITAFGYLFILPGYRAKLAGEVYGERDMPFWKAHMVSGQLFKALYSLILLTPLPSLSSLGKPKSV